MSVESADENFERKRDETKTMVGLENPKTPKPLGFPGHCFENYDPTGDEPHVAFIKSTPNPKTRNRDMIENKGVGGIFMMLLEGVVVGIGCASFFAYRFYKGEKLPF